MKKFTPAVAVVSLLLSGIMVFVASPISGAATVGVWSAATNLVPASSGDRAGVQTLSCTSAGNCIATGYYRDTSHVSSYSAIEETSGHWGTPHSFSDTIGALSGFNAATGVCTTPGNCIVAGGILAGTNSNAAVFTETNGHWDSGRTFEDSGYQGSVYDARCYSAGNCVLVGRGSPSANPSWVAPMVLREINGNWGSEQTVDLTGVGYASDPYSDHYGMATAVSCSSATECGITGYMRSSDGVDHLWATQLSGISTYAAQIGYPDTPDTDVSVGVPTISCPGTNKCVVVANAKTQAGTAPVILTQTGVADYRPSGVLVGQSLNTNDHGYLNSISCPSVGNCVAVGEVSYAHDNAARAIIVEEKNGIWGDAGIPLQPIYTSNMDSVLVSVSCASAGNCATTGTYLYNGGLAPLLFSEVAGVWQATNTNPVSGIDNAESAGLLVACTSDGGCSAIGHFSDGTTSRGYATSETLLSAATTKLPATGSNLVGSSWLVFALCGMGGGALLVSRRRKTQTRP